MDGKNQWADNILIESVGSAASNMRKPTLQNRQTSGKPEVLLRNISTHIISENVIQQYAMFLKQQCIIQ